MNASIIVANTKFMIIKFPIKMQLIRYMTVIDGCTAVRKATYKITYHFSIVIRLNTVNAAPKKLSNLILLEWETSSNFS